MDKNTEQLYIIKSIAYSDADCDGRCSTVAVLFFLLVA